MHLNFIAFYVSGTKLHTKRQTHRQIDRQSKHNMPHDLSDLGHQNINTIKEIEACIQISNQTSKPETIMKNRRGEMRNITVNVNHNPIPYNNFRTFTSQNMNFNNPIYNQFCIFS